MVVLRFARVVRGSGEPFDSFHSLRANAQVHSTTLEDSVLSAIEGLSLPKQSAVEPKGKVSKRRMYKMSNLKSLDKIGYPCYIYIEIEMSNLKMR